MDHREARHAIGKEEQWRSDCAHQSQHGHHSAIPPEEGHQACGAGDSDTGGTGEDVERMSG